MEPLALVVVAEASFRVKATALLLPTPEPVKVRPVTDPLPACALAVPDADPVTPDPPVAEKERAAELVTAELFTRKEIPVVPPLLVTAAEEESLLLPPRVRPPLLIFTLLAAAVPLRVVVPDATVMAPAPRLARMEPPLRA